VIGVTLGLAAAIVVLILDEGGRSNTAVLARGPLLSECDGTLRQLVIHYTTDAADVVLPTYKEFLDQIPEGVTVRVVSPSAQAYDHLVTRLGPTKCTLAPVIVNHRITAWSRDRWLAFGPSPDRKMLLLCSRSEDAANVWKDRAEDQRVAEDLAAALAPNVIAQRSDLDFDGGDFAADSETVFVRPNVLLRNLQRTVATRTELIDRLTALFKRRVVLFNEAPDHHVAMYLIPVGQRTIVVGDPRLTKRLLSEIQDDKAIKAYLPGGPDFSEMTLARFDAVAEQCRELGYKVVRIPLVPGVDGRTYITYVNAILDKRDGRSFVYMPKYAPADSLNRAAAKVWTELGYEVNPVDVTACARFFGTLHCLVNVLQRK
jgi:N-dimethylarginine dimethylaminohydrolase